MVFLLDSENARWSSLEAGKIGKDVLVIARFLITFRDRRRLSEQCERFIGDYLKAGTSFLKRVS
jgi:hypothetical protein